MLHHVVMWTLKDFAEGNSKSENLKITKEKLEDLKLQIPEIKELEVGVKMEASEFANYDLILDTYFDNYEDLKKYQNHPEHKKIVEWLSKVRDLKASVDYEI
ncbi:MAG: stress responsive protein [Bacteroidetes bacterium GWF2_33_16]|nr:MAG: stress responsive protein [Bacteroidetes bacterium GWE2_32_14]OFY05578.1 MAG: stress responsive protein [Bacteroidetes bacterium GWF2_33_16]